MPRAAAGAAALSLQAAAQVLGPMKPTTFSPALACRSSTAASVFGPKYPVPTRSYPRVPICFCQALSSSEESPSWN